VLALGLALLPAGARADDCLLEPVASRYVARVQDRILDGWELPEDGMAGREVEVVLVLAADGSLASARLVASTDTRLARSVAVAILVAQPFGPIPPEASCLVGRPILTTFRNPAD
jgi:hypothetical protein